MAASSDGHGATDIERAVAEAAAARRQSQDRRLRLSLAVSAAVTVVWLVGVTVGGLWSRALDHWVASVTMVFGSFVAGSTPQGGGAVAFPVFTKLLSVPAEAARSFSLCIQAVGMTTAAASIAINRRQVEWRAAGSGAALGSISLVAALLLFGSPDDAFWPMNLPGDYVKVTFTLVVLAMGVVVVIGSRIPIRAVTTDLPPLNGRLRTALVVAGLLGGVASALVGSGADVMVYLFVVVLFGVRTEVGVPTSVVTMAAVSVVGFVMLAVIDGQFQITFDGAGEVTTVGGHRLDEPTPASQADLFGMWLAAVPIVAWGAPLGALVASRMSRAALVRLAVGLAFAEVISTVIFLDALRSDTTLQIYAVVGALVSVVGLALLAANRRALFGLPDLDLSTLLTRTTTEVSRSYQEEF